MSEPTTDPNAVSLQQPLNSQDWPGGFKLYKAAKTVTKVNLGLIVAIYIIYFVVIFLLKFLFKSDFLYQLISFVGAAVLASIYTNLFIASARDKKVSLSEAMSAAKPFIVPMFAAIVLLYIILAISFILLIVPFFFVLPRLTLTPYFLVDRKLGPIDALKASWAETNGHAGKVWGIIGVNIVFGLLAVTIIGIPFSIYFVFMYSSATVLLYNYIKAHPTATT